MHESDYQAGGTPVINPASLRDNEIVPINRMAVGPETVERLATFRLCDGDIVMARRGEMGRCAVVTTKEAGWLCGTGCLILRFWSELHIPYFALLIGSPEARRYLAGASVGATMRNLNQSILLSMPIDLPPVAEQERAVDAVQKLQSLLGQLEAAQAEREQRRASVRRTMASRTQGECSKGPEIFIQSLAPEFTETSHLRELRGMVLSLGIRGRLSAVSRTFAREKERCTNEARLDMNLPQGWTWVQLPEVADVRLGKMLDRAKNRGDEYPYLRNTNVHWFDIRTDDLLRLRMEEAEAEKYLLREGDVLICEGGHGIGRTAVWRGAVERVAFQKALHRVRPGSKLDPDFFSYCMAVYAEEGVLARQFTGVGIPHLTGEGLKRLEFPLPPIAEQREIVTKIQKLFPQIQQLAGSFDEQRRHAASLLESLLARSLASSSVQTESAPEYA